MRHLHIILLVISLALLGLLACTPESPKPIRIGLNSWPGYEYLALAEQLGYYQEEGVEVKLIPFQTLADGLRAFEKGQFDIMAGTLMEFYSAREVKDLNPIIFMVADFSNGADMVLAHKSIAEMSDLKDKRLGLEAGSVDVLTAANALASAGLTFSDVTLVNMPQPNAIKALLAGKLDAVETYPPFATEALKSPDIVRLFDTTQTPGQIVDIMFARGDIASHRKSDLAKVVRAFHHAVLFHSTHTDDANARMAQREGITATEFAEALTGLKVVGLDEQKSFLSQGKIIAPLIQTHQALTALDVIKGPVCGRECYIDVTHQ